MQIDKNSQVKLIDLISQTVVTSIDDFPVDIEPNRIKEKKESLKNTLVNCFNVPMSKKYMNNKKDYSVTYSIIDFNIDSINEGNRKPINVNEKMLEGIKNSSFLRSDLEKTTNIVNKEETLKKEKINASGDIEKLISKSSEIRTQIDDKMKKIKLEKEEIESLNNVIHELALQYDEVEQEYEKAKVKENELQNRLISVLNNQIDSLNNELNDINRLSDEIDGQKNDNNSKIIEFKKKILSTKEKITEVNNEIDKKEHMLSLFDKKINNDDMFENNDKENQIRKFA